MKSIAVLHNSEGFTSSPKEESIVSVYTQNFPNDSWEVSKEFAFSLKKSLSISELRKLILNMLESIGDCRIFVAREVAGQLYSVLEANRFSIYEVVENGTISRLDSSFGNKEHNNLNEATAGTLLCYPEKTGVEGKFFLNLKAALDADPNLTSKKILLPFLLSKDFRELEVICDHIPRWFKEEFEKQGLQSTTSELEKNEYKVVISLK